MIKKPKKQENVVHDFDIKEPIEKVNDMGFLVDYAIKSGASEELKNHALQKSLELNNELLELIIRIKYGVEKGEK